MDIAIWGSGNFGRYIARQIKESKAYDIRYFVDSNNKLWGTKVDDIEVISPEQLQQCKTGEVEFLLVAFTDGIAIYQRLSAMKLRRFGIIHNSVYEAQLVLEANLLQDRNILWNDAECLGKPLLEHLETNIVDDCNLNCKGCSHFSNLFEHGEKIPFETFCRDLKRIAENVYIYQFNLLGGEALLEDRIIDYIVFARETLPDSEIQLITNGMLIPRQKADFFKCCVEKHITISISGYLPTLRMQDQIFEVLKKNQTAYSFRPNKERFGKNIDLTGTADLYESVQRCRENKCHFLRNGKIYKCPFEALGNKLFEYYKLDLRLDGGVDIYDTELDWNMLVNDLSHKPVASCRYCGEEEKFDWNIANFPVLEDWVVNKSIINEGTN